ncbi:MAG: GGDEF domain-containing protein [Phycisphaerales bacterium]|nr:GGDEF domain-containing protein [Phycisphaerales bacterium]
MPIDEGQVEHDRGQGYELGRGGDLRSPRGSGWRVILVGRTGLDQVLRRVEGVELIRTRDSFDAIGELSDPIDDASPARAAVLVSVEAEPSGEELGQFVSALRMVDPAVKIIRVGESHAMYDGAVGMDASGARVMEVIEGAVAMPVVEVVYGRGDEAADEGSADVESPEAETPVIETHEVSASDESNADDGVASVSATVETELTEMSADEKSPDPAAGVLRSEETDEVDPEARDQVEAHGAREVMELHQRVVADVVGGTDGGSFGGSAGGSVVAGPVDGSTDEAVIRALGDGRSVVEVAVGLIGKRIGRDDVEFTTGAVEHGVAVHSGGRVHGSLVCEDLSWMHRAGARVLAEHAVWLGAWLRLEQQQRALRMAAFTDELTGAWNRRYFKRFLDAAIEQARSARRTLTLLYFDIDDFKGYNDRYGHEAGDEILVETVRLLESVIRPGDKVCRIGGDEFVVIFYEPKGPRDLGSSPPESIYSLATRFQQQICEHRFPKLGDEACGTLTISGGLASFPWDGSDGESLLAVADRLAMQSKRSGKNVITLGAEVDRG